MSAEKISKVTGSDSLPDVLTCVEMAEALNIRHTRGPQAGQLNLEYVREKFRTRAWPGFKLPGSRFIRFHKTTLLEILNGTLGVEAAASKRSLKIERVPEIEAHPQRKERRWR